MISEDELKKAVAALDGALTVLEDLQTTLLSKKDPGVFFSNLDQKSLTELYYSHLVSITAHWEVVREYGVKLCHSLSDANAAADEKTLRNFDERFRLFLRLEQAAQVFTTENETAIHDKDHSTNSSTIIQSIQALCLAIRQFKAKLEE